MSITRDGLIALFGSNFPDNNDNEISAADLRQGLIAMLNQLQLKDVEGYNFAHHEDVQYKLYDLVLYRSGLWVANKTSIGAFDPTNFDRVLAPARGIAAMTISGTNLYVRYDDSTTNVDLGRVVGNDGATGPQGIQGATGATGATGAKGDKGDAGGLLTPQSFVWASGFFDRTGFSASASGTGASSNLTQLSESTSFAPAQGVYLLKTGTAASNVASMRRDSTNGAGYQYYISGSKFKFDLLVNFNVLPTSLQPYSFLISFHSNTGPSTDQRAAISLEYNSTAGRATFYLASATSTSVSTKVNSSVTVSANTWYKLSLEIDRDNSTVKMYINNTLDSTITTNMPPVAWHGLFISATNGVNTLSTGLVVAIDHYQEKIDVNSTVNW